MTWALSVTGTASGHEREEVTVFAHVLGAVHGAIGVIGSDVAVGAVMIAAMLSFVTALALAVGRGREGRDDDVLDRPLVR